MSVVVEQVVGELEFVERDDLLHPLRALGRRVGVDVDAAGHVRVGLAGDHPARRVERVAIALVVDRHEVHHQHVVGHRVEAVQAHLERREHPPVSRRATQPAQTIIIIIIKRRPISRRNIPEDITRARYTN